MARRVRTTSLLIATLLAHCTLAVSTDLSFPYRDFDDYPSNNITYSPPSSAQISHPSNPLDYVPISYTKVRVVHGVLASVAWLILFPLGGMIPCIRRELVFPLHAGVQMFAYTVFAVAAGMGIWMARHIHQLGGYHPVIGMILLGLLAIQPLTETLNAVFYNPARHNKIIILGHIHIWLGRALLATGIVNGGLGFLFSESFPWNNRPLAPKIVYGVVAVVVWIAYVCVAFVRPCLKRNGFPFKHLKPKFGKRRLGKETEVVVRNEELDELGRGSERSGSAAQGSEVTRGGSIV